MDIKLQNLLAKTLSFLNDEQYIRLKYRFKLRKKLNLESPRTFCEKIQWLKLNDHNPAYTQMVDKYTAKKYVEGLIGKEYITPTLGCYDSFDQINFDELPNQFVLKCNHDCGSVVVCTDKSVFDVKAAKKKMEQGLHTDYYLLAREWPYKNVKRKIIAEEYMENDAKEGLHDYKVWCFNGDAKYVQYITGRKGQQTYEAFYDWDWKLQPFTFHNPLLKTEIKEPARLEELFDLASKLAQGLPFARIDFYVLPDDSIRFGEITLYPFGGIGCWHPEEMDRKFGDMIQLPYGDMGEIYERRS